MGRPGVHTELALSVLRSRRTAAEPTRKGDRDAPFWDLFSPRRLARWDFQFLMLVRATFNHGHATGTASDSTRCTDQASVR